MKNFLKISIVSIFVITLLLLSKVSYAAVVELDDFNLSVDKLLGFNDIHIGDSWDVVEKNCENLGQLAEVEDSKLGDLDCYGRYSKIIAKNNEIIVIWFSIGFLDKDQLQKLLSTMSSVHNDFNIQKPDEYTYVLKNGQIIIQNYDGDFMLAYIKEQYAEEVLGFWESDNL